MAEEEKRVQLPVNWIIDKDTPTGYATNIVISRQEHEYYLYFFDVQPPFLIGSPEEIEATLDKIEAIEGRCIARIIIAKDRMPDFLRVMIDNVANSGDIVVTDGE